MLVRVRGGKAGIADYLRHGHKAGREHTRDQLDERVTLAGDLDLTDAIVSRMSNEGNRYVHVTLAFKEDHIAPEVLQAITDDFKAFAASAYADDELNFYAEAHLPRIKHYTNHATGEQVERKPHIHVVIPQKNLLSGEQLNPFGIGDFSNDFLKAFQERVNAQHGLSSPDDNPRDTFNNESAMISRYKGDEFSGAHKALKAQIRDDVIALGIESREAFHQYLAERWETSAVNVKGKPHLAIRPEADGKRVRLTEAFFSMENIERPTSEKLAAQQKNAEAYVAAAQPKQASEAHRKREAFWHDYRAKEIKYLNSGRRGEWKRYKAADPTTRAAMLAEKEANHYTKHRKELDHDLNANGRNVTRHIDANIRAAGRHLDAAGRVDRNDELARRRLDDRRIARATRAIVHGRGGDQAPAREQPIERGADSVAGAHLAKLQDQRQQARGEGRAEMDEIKRQLDGHRLLAHLSHTHGVQPDKYQVIPGEGGDRIQCGTKAYNVTDFCTKEMHLPFAEAAPVLRECYADQKRELGIEAKPRPREALWRDYSTQWRPEQRKQRGAAMAEQKKREQRQRREITEAFRRDRAKLSADRSMTPADKKAERSVLRVRQIEVQQALKQEHAQERDALAEQYPTRPTFDAYLQEQAQAGSVDALAELRRQRKPERREREGLAVTSKEQASPVPFEPLAYRVSRNGDVTYYDQRGDVLRDDAKSVAALRNDDATVATALRVAERKFYQPGQQGGTEVALHGNDEQIRKAIEVAARENIAVRFMDPQHEAMRQDLQAKHRAGRAFIADQQRHQGAKAPRENQRQQPTPKQDPTRKGPTREDSPKPDRSNDRGDGNDLGR